MEVVIFLALKTAGKAFPLFEAQDLLAELSLPPLKWKRSHSLQSSPGNLLTS